MAYLRFARDSSPLLVPCGLFYSLSGLFHCYIDILGRNVSAQLAQTRKGFGVADSSKHSRVRRLVFRVEGLGFRQAQTRKGFGSADTPSVHSVTSTLGLVYSYIRARLLLYFGSADYSKHSRVPKP